MTGALITLKVQARQSKLSTTFSLHQEFHSGELMKARVEADILLRKQWNIKLADIDDRFQDKANCIWVVMNFYSRLYHALNLQRIEIDYVPSMFGEHIVWWWTVHFADRLEGGQWSSYDMMAKLNVWLEVFCRGSRYDWAHRKWMESAIKCRRRYSAAASQQCDSLASPLQG